MDTQLVRVSATSPGEPEIRRAADVIRRGGLVAFPTETVYGLGASALDAAAVERVFAAKGRPATNPVIVHVTGAAAAQQVVSAWPPAAAALAERFWPGPLTLVLPGRACIPRIVSAGGDTVAVRAPAHPVAMALLECAGAPIAAPSANRSTRLSPTRASHVMRGLSGRIDMVLDGGPTAGGIESTVLDLSVTPARLLRPGLVTPAEIEAIIGSIVRGAGVSDGPARSPGMMARHYAPRALLECAADGARERAEAAAAAGERVALMALGSGSAAAGVMVERMPAEPAAYAARLYDTLHALDDAGVEHIVVELPPEAEGWLAVRDRLARASARP